MKDLFVYTKRIPSNGETPVTLYEKLVGEKQGFLLESNDVIKGRYSFVGKNNKDLRQSLNEIKENISKFKVHCNESISFTGGYVGVVTYDVAKELEEVSDKNPDNIGFPKCNFFFIDEFLAYDHKTDEIILASLYEEKLKELEDSILKGKILEREKRAKSKELNIKYHVTKEDFINKVNKAKDYIEDGDIFQVVLSQRVSMDINVHPLEIYKTLRVINPSPYLFYFNFNDFQVVGSSPESMVEVRNGVVTTCPIAGTRPRGCSEQEDERLKEELLADEKERAEHLMLVDLARNDIGKISKIGTVKVPTFMNVEKYSHVMHIVSLVNGEIKDELNGVDAVLATLPAGTLSGAPKIRAMEIIEELEEEKRGVYGGAIGYFGLDGNMDTCIGIRMVVCKDNKAFVQAGAGIVMDSIPEKEYEETLHKASAIITAIRKAEGEKI